jgi:hypothetical protein
VRSAQKIWFGRISGDPDRNVIYGRSKIDVLLRGGTDPEFDYYHLPAKGTLIDTLNDYQGGFVQFIFQEFWGISDRYDRAEN